MQVNQVRAGAILSYVSMAVSTILSLVYAPIMKGQLGTSEYGVYGSVGPIIAYLLLLSMGLVESHTGAKSCVHADAGRVAALRQELTETELRAMVRSMKRMGLDRQSAWSLFERLYAEEETE